MNKIINEIERLHDLTMDDLYVELFSTSAEGHGVLGAPGMRSRKGQSLFNRVLPKLRECVCDQWGACEKIEQYQNLIQLSEVLATLISPVVPQISPAVAAVIIVKMGLSKFCNC
jgi:hypothetical protein